VTRVVTIVIAALIFVFAGQLVSANGGQYGPYGPSPVLSIDVNKTVQRANNSDFVDNLSPSDQRFVPGQDVFFRITVKNPTDETLTNVTVKDFVPEFVDVIETPGSYDSSNRTITINAGDFGPKEEKTYTLKTRAVGKDSMPTGTACRTNKAQAFNSSVSDEDTSQFCVERVEKQVTNVTQIPSTGPEMGLGILLINALGFGTGVILRKKS